MSRGFAPRPIESTNLHKLTMWQSINYVRMQMPILKLTFFFCFSHSLSLFLEMCDVRICKVVDAAVAVSGIPLSTLLLTCWIWLHIWGWWWWIPMTSFDTYTMYFNSIKSEMCNQFTKRKTNKDFRRETAHLRSLCVVCMLQRKRPQQTTVTKATAKANGNSTHVSYCNKDTYRERRCTQSELEHGDSNNIDPESSAHSNLLRMCIVHQRAYEHSQSNEREKRGIE